ncbi:uncharacterized protein [Choristoneura fumiferana]|uniref:uncharacterized protein n=1 Tax=Choristoneura fumiferana TaxID=7141 RepID=UPI003D15DD4D
MSRNNNKQDLLQPSTLQEAINIIKFLTTTHKQEVKKLKESHQKQTDIIKKLEANRRKELEFLSSELQNYEVNLAISKETVTKQLAEKDDIIQKQAELIEELNRKLKIHEEISLPEINIVAPLDSNSDSGVAMENDESNAKSEPNNSETKTTRKYSRRFAESISFLRRVDFSPMKYKPCSRECNKKKDEKKSGKLEVPFSEKGILTRQNSSERVMSDDDNSFAPEPTNNLDHLVIRPKKMEDSMNNHFSDDGSEDTSEEIFDRVMTRSSIRRSVKANPKYKKINRTKSKLLEQVKVNIID